MNQQPDDRSDFIAPVNYLPPVIVILFLAIVGIEIAFLAASEGFVGGAQGIGWRSNAVQDYAFSPLVWEEIIQNGNRSLSLLRRLVTYPFIHGSFTHALLAGVLMLALGKFVGELLHWLALVVLLIVTTVIGAVAFGMWHEGSIALVGSYPAVYGLIGAYTYLMWLHLGNTGQNQLGAFRLIGVFLALQLLFAVIFAPDPAWIAEVAGFFAGLIIAPLLAKGGFRSLLARMRRD